MRVVMSVLAIAAMACGGKAAPAPPPAKIRLAVLPAESDQFPTAAQAITNSLTAVELAGVDEKHVSKVSLEVVQLSIECVEQTPDCYEAVAKSLAAHRLLFADIIVVGKKQLAVSVTLFDADTRSPKTAQKVFPSEKAISEGIAALVAEATR